MQNGSPNLHFENTPQVIDNPTLMRAVKTWAGRIDVVAKCRHNLAFRIPSCENAFTAANF